MANMNDVARIAGVSRGTVSNYLNHGRVREDSKKKIERAIAELHYVRNETAREFRLQSSQYVVFIIPTVWTPFFAELTYFIQLALKRHGYKMILCISNSNYNEEREYVEMADKRKVAGIISISYSQMNKYVRTGMPLVSIEKEITGLFPLVSSDNYAGGRLAAEKLFQSGCKKLLFIGSNHSSSEAMSARQSGFVDYCHERQIPYQVCTIASSHNYDRFRKDLQQLLETTFVRSRLVDAGIFAITDEYAHECLIMLNKFGIQVPEQVQIIGFDGGKTSVNDHPVLSSIRQPVEKIAEVSVMELIRLIKNESDKQVPRIMLPVTFQRGQTTK